MRSDGKRQPTKAELYGVISEHASPGQGLDTSGITWTEAHNQDEQLTTVTFKDPTSGEEESLDIEWVDEE